jgi:superfamily II DNA helicase RecQ
MSDDLSRLAAALTSGDILDPSLVTASPHRRLARALAARGTAVGPGPRELAVLVRQVLRHETVRSGGDAILTVPAGNGWPTQVGWEGAGLRVLNATVDRMVLSANSWQPSWMGGASPDDDAAAEWLRRNYQEVPGDPCLQVVKRERYRSVGQREAVRAILSSPPGATLAVNLPTGAGKSLCAQLPALFGVKGHGVTVVVVPTTALAMDQERAFAEHVTYPTAYYSDSSVEGQQRRAEIRERIREGQQDIVFVSPEALVGSLASSLYTAAQHGMLRYLVIDEAHLIDQWGDAFRPHFQAIPGLRRDLLRLGQFRTLLFTATMTEGCLDNLETLFAGQGPFGLISACQLRPEPSYWFAHCADQQEKTERLLEALDHLPRPLIIYGSKVQDVEDLATTLRQAGFRRLDYMTGKSGTADRLALLDRWRAGELDIVVATSAFGLGVDQSDVRAVLHVCVPETIDRYYQEVGRGGRDGAASVALMLYTDADKRVALDLNDTKLITVEKALMRWKGMFASAERLEGNRLRVDLNARAQGDDKYMDMKGKRHRGWNANLLNLMARARMIEMDFERPPLKSEFEDDEVAYQEALKVHENSRVIRILDDEGISRQSVWEERFEKQRLVRHKHDARALEVMFEALNSKRCLSAIFTDAYSIQSRDFPTRRPPVIVAQACGGCPHCRRIGESPFACDMPQPSPVWSVSPPLGTELMARLDRDNLLMIYYEPGPRDDWENRRASLLRWLVKQGVQNVVMPPSMWSKVSREISRGHSEPVFCYPHLDPLWMAPVATVVLHEPGTAIDWSDVSPDKGDPPLIHILPAATPDPARADRPLREVLDRGRAYSFDPFCQELSL